MNKNIITCKDKNGEKYFKIRLEMPFFISRESNDPSEECIIKRMMKKCTNLKLFSKYPQKRNIPIRNDEVMTYFYIAKNKIIKRNHTVWIKIGLMKYKKLKYINVSELKMIFI